MHPRDLGFLRHRSLRHAITCIGVILLAGSAACATGPSPVANTAAPGQSVPPEATSPLPPSDACRVPTFGANDPSSDCVDDAGNPVDCRGLDLLGVEAGILGAYAGPPLPTGFLVTLAHELEPADPFELRIYLDLDQDAATGLDMSAAGSALPGIDRLVVVSLPSAEAWTQAVGLGEGAEVITDEAQVSAGTVGDLVVVLLARALLEDKSAVAYAAPALTNGSPALVRYSNRSAAAGASPDTFSMYIGTQREAGARDFFNVHPDLRAPLAMTVVTEALYPPCPGGS